MQTVGREVHVQDPSFTFLRYLCEWLTGAVLLAADMKKIVSAKLTHKHARTNVIVVFELRGAHSPVPKKKGRKKKEKRKKN